MTIIDPSTRLGVGKPTAIIRRGQVPGRGRELAELRSRRDRHNTRHQAIVAGQEESS
jgi:hypothetical protein